MRLAKSNIDNKKVTPQTTSETAGLDFATVDIQKIVSSYERELEVIRSTKDNNDLMYRVQSIDILVGVDGLYPDAYIAELDKWVNQFAQKNYGPRAKTQVKEYKSAPVAPVQPTEKTIWDYIENLQFIWAALLFVLGGLLMVILYRLLSPAIEKNLPSNKAPEFLPSPRPTDKDPGASKDEIDSLSFQEVDFFTNHLEKLRSRLSSSLKRVDVNLGHILFFWLEQKEQGVDKICCLMESTEDPEVESRIQEVISHQKESIRERSQSMGNLPITEKIRVYESAYWDLVCYRLLGAQAYEQPFSFLGTIDARSEKLLLDEPDIQNRSLAIAFLKKPSQEKLIEKMSSTEKEKVIQYLVTHSRLAKPLMIDSESVLKVKMAQSRVQQDDTVIDILPKAKEFVENIPVHEQCDILFSLLRRKDRVIDTLKEQILSIAFFMDWNDSFSKDFIKILSPEELYVFCSQFAYFESRILTLAPNRSAAILRDELKQGQTVSLQEKITYLASIQEKAKLLIEERKLSLSQIYQGSETNVSKAA